MVSGESRCTVAGFLGQGGCAVASGRRALWNPYTVKAGKVPEAAGGSGHRNPGRDVFCKDDGARPHRGGGREDVCTSFVPRVWARSKIEPEKKGRGSFGVGNQWSVITGLPHPVVASLSCSVREAVCYYKTVSISAPEESFECSNGLLSLVVAKPGFV